MENLQKETRRSKSGKKRGIIILLGMVVIVAGMVGLVYWETVKNQIYIEKAEVFAPTIALSSNGGGMLREVFVKEGDIVPADSAVARIGDEIVKTSTRGLVIQTKNNVGEKN